MTTLAIMKARIASDLRRDDLTSDIADYITEAIGDFQHKRFYFNETRAYTFNTVNGTQRYTVSEFPNVVNILKIDGVYITVGGNKYNLFPWQPIELERMTVNTGTTGQTTHYAFYDNSIWLYPIPTDAWAVTILCQKKIAAPADDNEASNIWMTDAARMIRCQAKGHLYAHVIQEMDKAQIQYGLAKDALSILEEKTADLVKVGDNIVEAYD